MRAKYADGTDRDVTSLAYYMTNNDVSAAVSQEGVVTAGTRGEAFIMARFSTHTVGIAVHRAAEGTQVRVSEGG